jgi:glycerol kinase
VVQNHGAAADERHRVARHAHQVRRGAGARESDRVLPRTRRSDICKRLVRRFGSTSHFQRVSGLPIATYFSVYKLLWMLEHVPAVAEAVADGRAAFGTIDSWLIYNLTGGGVHVTDVTNASRTGLMDLSTCTWHAPTAAALGVPLHVLPTIKSNAEVYGHVVGGPLAGVPICGCLGDQQAATLGQRCRVGACARLPAPGSQQLRRACQARPRAHTAPAASCC